MRSWEIWRNPEWKWAWSLFWSTAYALHVPHKPTVTSILWVLLIVSLPFQGSLIISSRPRGEQGMSVITSAYPQVLGRQLAQGYSPPQHHGRARDEHLALSRLQAIYDDLSENLTQWQRSSTPVPSQIPSLGGNPLLPARHVQVKDAEMTSPSTSVGLLPLALA